MSNKYVTGDLIQQFGHGQTHLNKAISERRKALNI